MTIGYDVIIVTQLNVSWPASQLKNSPLTFELSFIKVALEHIYFKRCKRFVGTTQFRSVFFSLDCGLKK